MKIDCSIDTSGLTCPLPLLKAKKEMSLMKKGQVLHIIATDPGTLKDFASYSKQTGHLLLDTAEEKGKFLLWLQKN